MTVMGVPLQILTFLAALICCLGLSMAAPQEDLVTDLPGLSFTPTFKHYSGYLDVLPVAKFHYSFVEATSNPASAPVVLSLVEGQACSAMITLMSGHGPFSLQEDGRTIKKNDYSWNNVANIIYLDAPSWTGFSKQVGKVPTDIQTAKNMAAAVESFYKKFPEYKNNDFYIASEFTGSTFAMLLGKDIPKMNSTLNVKGYMFLQGVFPIEYAINSFIYDSYYRGLIGKELFDKILMICCKTLDTSFCDISAQTSPECNNVFLHKFLEVVNFYNLYNLYYPVPGGVLSIKSQSSEVSSYSNIVGTQDFGKNERFDLIRKMIYKTATYACDSKNLGYMTKYFDQNSVVKALHVKPDKPWAPFQACHNTQTMLITDDDLFEGYKNAFNQKKRTMFMFGNMAFKSTPFAAELIMGKLNQTQTSPKHTWFYNDAYGWTQLGGRVNFYGNVSYFIVNGAGERVTQDAPASAFQLIKEFFNGFTSLNVL